MKYAAILFRQNTNSPPQLLFVTSTAELDCWSRVPTRMTSRPEGFQRTEIKGHVEDLKEFFGKDTTHSNSSPTSLLVGFDPAHQEFIKVFGQDGQEIRLSDPSSASKTPRIVSLEIQFPAWDSSKYRDDLAGEITALFREVEESGAGPSAPDSQPEGSVSAAGSTASVLSSESGSRIGDDSDEEGKEVLIDEVSDDEDNEEGVLGDEPGPTSDNPEMGTESGETPAKISEQGDSASSGIQLTADNIELQSFEALRTAWSENRVDKETQSALRDLLKTGRKPGLVIDGQHRVKATRNADFPFSVCFLPLSPWEELAFQFIVNNHTAKKVDENLLTAIVGQSLSDTQLLRIESRLSRAGIKVQLIKAATRVQVEDNPFRGMLMTGTEGEQGFLRSTAMQSNVLKLWYGDHSKRGKYIGQPTLASFRLLDEDSWALHRFAIQKLFLVNCAGKKVLDRKLHWQREMWFLYFKAFWAAVRDVYLPSGVWPATRAQWPAPDHPMTPDQKRVNKFMRTTLLGPFQVAVMQNWAERRLVLCGSKMPGLAKKTIDPDVFTQEIKDSLGPLTADFFTSLKASGFAGSTSVRDNTKQMLWLILRGTKTVADIKAHGTYGQYFD